MESLDTASRYTATLPLLDEMTARLHTCWSAMEAGKISAYAISHLCPGSAGALYVRDAADRTTLRAIAVWGEDTPAVHSLPLSDAPAVQQRTAVLDDAPRTDPRAAPPSYDLPLLDGGLCYGMLHIRGASPDGINPPVIPQAWLLPAQIMARHIAATLARFAAQDERMERVQAHAQRTDQPYTVLLLQPEQRAALDRQMGTATVDGLLEQLELGVRDALVAHGYVWRLRRTVLLVVLPGCDAAAANLNIQQIQQQAASLPHTLRIAIGGVVADAGRTTADVLQAAEECLLRAEIAGDGVAMLV